jgi:transposase
MLRVPSTKARVFVRPGPTDLRKQVNGLAVLVEQQMKESPFGEAVFLFCNRERRILKALWWDGNGFCLWYKRLEKHRFPWPQTGEEAAREIDAERLAMLLSGIDFWQAHEQLSYQEVS